MKPMWICRHRRSGTLLGSGDPSPPITTPVFITDYQPPSPFEDDDIWTGIRVVVEGMSPFDYLLVPR
jgi:hypothetical protein